MTVPTTDAKDNRPQGDGRPMTAEEQAAFLAEPQLCHLACLDDEGHPYVVPVWFEHADGGFYFVARARAAWGGYLQRDPRVVRPQRVTSQTGGGWAGRYKHYPWQIRVTPPPPSPLVASSG